MACVLTSILTLAAPAGGSEDAPAADPTDPFFVSLALEDLLDLIEEDAAAAAEGLIEAKALSRAGARSLIDGLLAQERLWGEDLEPSPLDFQAAEGALLAALAEAPESELVGEALAQFYWSTEWREPETPSARLIAGVSALADPARTGLMLSDRIGPGAQSRALLGLALERRPGHPVLLHQAAELTGALAVRAALYEAAWETLSATTPGPPRAVMQFFAARRLAALVAAGELTDAEAFFDEIDGAVELDRYQSTAIDAEIDGLPLRLERADLRLQLAFLGWWTGRPDAALRFLATELAAGPGRGEALASVAVLASLLGHRTDDRFRLLADLVVATADGVERLSGAALLVCLAAAELAEREGYPGIASYFLLLGVERLERDAVIESGPAEPWRFDLPPLGTELESRIRTHVARRQALADELRARRAWLTAAPAAGDAGARAIARSLAAGAPRFVEQPLPAGMPPAEVQSWFDDDELEPEDHGVEVPAGFRVRRGERVGREVVAVAEDERSALWVLRSLNGGSTWAEPLATGLRWREPYEVTAASALPMIAGDGLRLEVALWESRDGEIEWEEPDAEPEPLGRGIYLEIPRAVLERDADGDGVTDLEEALLLTDPALADSDGDGLIDGLDALPHVTGRRGCDSETRALVTILRAIDTGHWRGDRTAGPGGCSFVAETDGPAGDGPLYLAGRREWFGQLHPAAPVVVLEEAEVDAARARLGRPDPIHLKLFTFDRSGGRLIAVWREGWGGGVEVLREVGGVWRVSLSVSFGGCVTTIVDVDGLLDFGVPFDSFYSVDPAEE